MTSVEELVLDNLLIILFHEGCLLLFLWHSLIQFAQGIHCGMARRNLRARQLVCYLRCEPFQVWADLPFVLGGWNLVFVFASSTNTWVEMKVAHCRWKCGVVLIVLLRGRVFQESSSTLTLGKHVNIGLLLFWSPQTIFNSTISRKINLTVKKSGLMLDRDGCCFSFTQANVTNASLHLAVRFDFLLLSLCGLGWCHI